MQWVAVSGSWRYQDATLEQDVRREAREIIESGKGLVSGGALGVDFWAAQEALLIDPAARHLKIIIPTPLSVYAAHFCQRAAEGVIKQRQADPLIAQLEQLKTLSALIEMDFALCDETSYYARNQKVIDMADELIAFQVNLSAGTQDAIDRARSAGKPVRLFSYRAPV